MAWGTLRKATDDDVRRFDAAQKRFVARYGIDPLYDLAASRETPDLVQTSRGWEDAATLRRYWRRAVTRALGSGADGIAYGYVGYNAS